MLSPYNLNNPVKQVLQLYKLASCVREAHSLLEFWYLQEVALGLEASKSDFRTHPSPFTFLPHLCERSEAHLSQEECLHIITPSIMLTTCLCEVFKTKSYSCVIGGIFYSSDLKTK